MEPATRLQIGQFMEKVARAPRRLLMLDYDGTLAPFRKERDAVSPYPEVAAMLQQILTQGKTRVVIVSGRDIAELPPRLGIQPIPELWGAHGRQRRRPGYAVETLPVEQRYLDALSEADRWLQYQQLTQIAESKAASIAAHWRGLASAEAEEVRARVFLGWESIAERGGLRILEFDGGVEIMAPDADKGDAVRVLLEEEGPDVAAVYMGDDSSDEFAFRAIRGCGLSVLVRPQSRPTAAQLWLNPPHEVVEFLNGWLAACRETGFKHDPSAVAVNR